MGANKAGMAAMELKVRAFVYLFLLAAAKTEHDFILLGDDFGKINADVRSDDSPARGVARVMGNLRAVNHRFGGSAADVDAGATEILLFDERDRPAEIRQVISKRVPALARADDNGVVFHADGPPERSGPKHTTGCSSNAEK